MQQGIRFGIAVALGALALSTAPAGAQVPGSLDASFDGDGVAVTPIDSFQDEGQAVALQPDGRIVVAGFSETGVGRRFAVVRYHPDGSLDSSFDGDGALTLPPLGGGARDEAYGVALQPDGKIVLAGDSYDGSGNSHFAVVRLNSDGSLDPSFDLDGIVTTAVGVRDLARAVALQEDGKIVVAGNAALFSGAGGSVMLARYNPDGSLDAAGFNDSSATGESSPPGTVMTHVGSSSTAHEVAIGRGGEIVVAGTTVAGNSEMLVIRYAPGGGLDSSFGPIGTPQAGVVITSLSPGTDIATSLDLLDDGRIITAGFSQAGSSFQLAAVRYLTNGHLDSSFAGDGIATTPVGSLSQGFGIRLDPQGRAVVAGEGVGGNRDFALVRYGTDGSLDGSFGTGGIVTTPVGTAIDGGRGLVLQPDGRIVVAGWTDSGLSQGDFAVVRYHGDAPPPPDRLLTVATGGEGGGTVVSQPAGIDCGGDCTEVYPDGTTVELTATPADGSSFAGWSGDCSGTGTCQITLGADRSATATFDVIPPPPPPAVVSTDPADGAAGVPVRAAVSATFDAPLDTFALTLTDDRERVVDGVTTCDTPCTTVTFTPDRALAGRRTYTAAVSGTGTHGSATETWTFTTAKKGGKPS